MDKSTFDLLLIDYSVALKSKVLASSAKPLSLSVNEESHLIETLPGEMAEKVKMISSPPANSSLT